MSTHRGKLRQKHETLPEKQAKAKGLRCALAEQVQGPEF
jgi:hypothetical protein